MAERAYTVKEIDELRKVCETRELFGSTNMKVAATMSRCYSSEELVKTVEERVRTYMLAGITADDIRAADEAR